MANVSFSQRESAIWYFGDFAGLDFNSGTPVPLTNSALLTKEGCATISDEDGNLLFYTDGTHVWNRQHQIMPNGSGLLGHSSSTESAMIIPKPGSQDAFYIFTIDKPSYFLTEGQPIDGVNYSEVNMALDGGMGDIVEDNKNTHLITYDVNDPIQNEYKSSEKITAVTHSDGSTIWVITQFLNKFFAFRVGLDGVNETPIVSTVPQTVYPRINDQGSNISAIGYLKVSPNGKKIAIAHSSTTLGTPNTGSKRSGKLLVYDFNNTTGMVTNEIQLLSGTYPYGVEFSPNSKLLYATSTNFLVTDLFLNSDLYQFNLESSNIPASKITLNTSANVAGGLQLAIDGKIYRAGYPLLQQGFFLSVINNPNDLGGASNYDHNTVNLGGRTSQLGLPPFIQSIFKFTFKYENICFGDATHFIITSEDPYDSVMWEFGDGQTSTLEDPLHTYSQPGNYYVDLYFTINNITQEPIRKQVTIYEVPEIFDGTYELLQCVSFEDNTGLTTFNLNSANGPLSLFSTDPIEVYYYFSEQEAIDDEDNANAINPIYTNQYPDEILYAKIYDTRSKCFNIGTIVLKTIQSIDLETFDFESCSPMNNGVASFDLGVIRNQIISQMNLPVNVSISFHENEVGAAIGANAVPDNYTSVTTTLFIRAESNNACYGNGLLNLIVKPFVVLQNETLEVCLSDFPFVIGSGISAEYVNDYEFLWNTNDTTSEILVEQPGIYTVIVSDPLLYCEGTKNIEVIAIEIPEIASIDVTDGNATITLQSPNGNFEYAMDNLPFQESNQFQNLQPGIHIAYVRDLFECYTIQQEFYVLGFPKFFTPNNDNIHDFWTVKGLDSNLFPAISVYIFNRYGKLLNIFDPNTSPGWSGKFMGNTLPSDDYWYYLKLPNGKEYKGHFTLKL